MIEKIELSSLTPDLKSLLLRFYDISEFIKRMRFLCISRELLDNFQIVREYLLDDIVGYIEVLGPDRCKALSYQKSRLARDYEDVVKIMEANNRILSELEVGKRYKVRDIKAYLDSIFSDIGIMRSPKATYISRLFNLKKCLISDLGKRHEGFEILSIKGEEGI